MVLTTAREVTEQDDDCVGNGSWRFLCYWIDMIGILSNGT